MLWWSVGIPPDIRGNRDDLGSEGGDNVGDVGSSFAIGLARSFSKKRE